MKQKNKIQLLLIAAFAGLGVMCYAQGKMCKDTPGGYNIVSLQDPSDPSSYQWMEGGKDIGGATAAVYTVPSDKAVGNYTYVRRSKKEGCDWASSNAYTVEVLICGDIAADAPNGTKGTVLDKRDGKVYKTVKMPDGKVWMAENLNYQEGLTFNQQAGQAKGEPFVSTENGVPAIGSFWCPAVSGATLSADRNTCNVYGALYTWETAMSANGGKDDIGGKLWNESTVSSHYHDISSTPAASQHDPQVQGICPAGYHLPSDYEWAVLLDAVDDAATTFINQAGGAWYGSNGVALTDHVGASVRLKSASTYLGADRGNGSWLDNYARGNDEFAFNLLPSGTRERSGLNYPSRGEATELFSSTPQGPTGFIARDITYNFPQPGRFGRLRSTGASVRCLEN
jgi:uncharacterized protein (TIGR02145 family)